MDRAELAAPIDHTLLAPDASPGTVVALVDEAVAHGFATVCVNPVYVASMRERRGRAAERHGAHRDD